MTNINSVIISGRATRDMEIKATSTGLSVGAFAIATNKKKSGEEDEVSFFECRIFGKYAEAMLHFVKKGTRMIVKGSIKQERWQDKTGTNRSSVSIQVEAVEILDSKKELPNNGGMYDEDPF